MTRKTAVPDAWDDDWESQADKIQNEPKPPAPEPAAATKSERLARHTESNRKLWESADTQKETFHFLEANDTVPLQSAFKPQVKVLSRKPMIAKRDPTTGLSQLSLEDDDEDKPKDVELTPEEIRARQKRDREEKQRKYDEARAKIFGESAMSSGASSPGGTVTPPRDGQTTPRGRGKGRGGQQRGNSDVKRIESRRQNNQSSAKELYDPNYIMKPEPPQGRRADGDASPRLSTPRNEQAPIRAPKGPDGSGRGGFGFARRGAKDA